MKVRFEKVEFEITEGLAQTIIDGYVRLKAGEANIKKDEHRERQSLFVGIATALINLFGNSLKAAATPAKDEEAPEPSEGEGEGQ